MTLQPTVKVRPQDSLPIQEELEEFFRQLLYVPLLKLMKEILPQDVKLNAAADDELYVMQKLHLGDIIYDGVYFTGKFNSRVSRVLRSMGASWVPQKKGFRLSPGKLTPDLKVAISSSKDRLKRLHDGLNNILDGTEAEIDKAVEDLDLSQGIEKVIKGLQAQTIKAMDAIGVKYTLTAGQRETLRKDYNENIKTYIKGWAEDRVTALRSRVTASALKGYRASELVESIQRDYGATKQKAKFLARQETSLFMSKFRRERFLQAGSQFYEWRTTNDRKVRDGHRVLAHRIFQWGDPPVDDPATGGKHEPGENFNCRCVAIPVMGKVLKRGTEWIRA